MGIISFGKQPPVLSSTIREEDVTDILSPVKEEEKESSTITTTARPVTENKSDNYKRIESVVPANIESSEESSSIDTPCEKNRESVSFLMLAFTVNGKLFLY